MIRSDPPLICLGLTLGVPRSVFTTHCAQTMTTPTEKIPMATQPVPKSVKLPPIGKASGRAGAWREAGGVHPCSHRGHKQGEPLVKSEGRTVFFGVG